MTKKKTVGGPRQRRLTVEDIQRRRQYQSRSERDHMWQRRVMAVTAVLVALSVFVLAAALITENLIRPRQAITTVNSDSIATNHFQDRVRFIRWQTGQQIRDLYYAVGGDANSLQQYASQQISALRSPSLMGGQVLDEMEEELLLKQAAKERSITVDDAAVQEQVDQFMASGAGLSAPRRYTPTPTTVPSVTPTPLVSPTPTTTPTVTPTETPTLTPTPVPSATATSTLEFTLTPTVEPTITLTPTVTPTLEPGQVRATLDQVATDFYKQARKGSKVDRSSVYEVFYYQALRRAMYDEISKDVPLEELQVNARHILIAFDPTLPAGQTPPAPTEEQKAAAKAKADEVLKALQDGEPFADLARVMSTDTGSAAKGGDLGWASPDGYTANFKDAVLNATPGEIIGPIETEFGYHIIQVRAREVRPLTSADLSTRKDKAFTDWLDQQRADSKIKRRKDWIDRIPNEPTYNSLLGDILQ